VCLVRAEMMGGWKNGMGKCSLVRGGCYGVGRVMRGCIIEGGLVVGCIESIGLVMVMVVVKRGTLGEGLAQTCLKI